MEKRRIKLNINGVVCGLITAESDEYMQSLADEVGELVKAVTASSPLITKEAAALMAALKYCDEAKHSDLKVEQIKEKMTELERKALEIERRSVELKKENKQLWEETEALLAQPQHGIDPAEREKLEDRISHLERENERLRTSGAETKSETEEKPVQPRPQGSALPLKNPLRNNVGDSDKFLSFFEKEEMENNREKDDEF